MSQEFNQEISIEHNKKIKYAYSLVLSAILLCFNWFFCTIRFETNDDTGILMCITGARTGKITADTNFCNIIWGGLLSSLYRINESIPWYIIVYMLLTWCALSTLCFCCIRIFTKKSNLVSVKQFVIELLMGGCVFCALFFSLFCYYADIFQFTVVSAFCGLSAILLMIAFPAGGSANYVVFSVLLLFACTIRPQIGFLTSGALVLFICILILLKQPANRLYYVLAGGIQVITYIVNYIYEYTTDWHVFRAYHKARSYFMDYPHPSFKDDPSFFKDTGWTSTLYNLICNWFFMDRRFNTAALHSVNSVGLWESPSIRSKLISMATTIRISKTQSMIPIVLFCIVCFTILMMIIRHEKSKLICIVGASIITVLIILLFLYRGRLPFRSLYSVLILYLLPVLFITYDGMLPIEIVSNRTIRNILIVSLMIITYSVLVPYGLLNCTRTASNQKTIAEGIRVNHKIQQYAVSHPQDIYIYDISLTLPGSPFETYENGKPYNLFFWGGSGMYSPLYYDQLKANGLDELYSDSFFNDNIYFVAKERPDPDLLQYMKEEYSDSVHTKLVKDDEEFIVYQFEK